MATTSNRPDLYRSKRIVIVDKIVDEGGGAEGEGEAAREEALRKNLTL